MLMTSFSRFSSRLMFCWLIALCQPVLAQSLWTDLPQKDQSVTVMSSASLMPAHSRQLMLDHEAMKFLLANSLPEGFASALDNRDRLLALPLPNGEMIEVAVEESPIMEPALAERYPEIKTYVARGKNVSGRLDMTPQGFHGVLATSKGMVYIDPRKNSGGHYYLSYYARDYNPADKQRPEKFCHLHGNAAKSVENVAAAFDVQLALAADNQLRTYRIAIAATGEYTQFHGGTVQDALSAVTTTLNRVNQIYENDLGVRMMLVANNDQVLFTDPTTDPYTGSDPAAMIGENQTTLNTVIGSANYDIGHVLDTGGGGLAGFGVTCGSNKAWGATGIAQPVGDRFDVDYVSHEIGHQFGAQHTFNGTSGSCSGNRNQSTAYEPGSGSTIMAYAGICAPENLQNQGDAMFHAGSIAEIRGFTFSGTGASCSALSTSGNTLPNVNAGADYSIPANTPFALSGIASDSDGNALSYSWEQMDTGGSTSSMSQWVDNGDRVIFRAFLPSSDPVRTFPNYDDIRNNIDTRDKGESLPVTDRALNFRLTVRDGFGGVAEDDTVLSVSSLAGPFIITAPNGGKFPSDTVTVTWDVAKTDVAPINCSNVDILLSTDDGVTFNTTLLTATPNDGSQLVTLPGAGVSTARIKLQCSDNIFFDISDASFTYSDPSNSAPVAVDDTFTANADSSNNIIDVLANDTDADSGDTRRIVSSSNPDQGGTVVLSSTADNNTLVYTPAPGFAGTETFTYTMQDAAALQSTATVIVTVVSVTAYPPNAVDDSYNVDQNSSDNILNVLANDTDQNAGDTKRIISFGTLNQGGAVTLSSNTINNTLLYTPATGFSGTETFTYTMEDALGAQSTATVTVTIAPPVFPPSGGGGGGSLSALMLLFLLVPFGRMIMVTVNARYRPLT